MARYELTGPDGSRYEMTAPDGATEQEVFQIFSQQFASQQPQTPRQQTSLESFGRGTLEGASFGLSDEIGAGIEAAMTAGNELLDFAGKAVTSPMRTISSALGIEPEQSLSDSAGSFLNKFSPAYEKSLGEIRAANRQSFEQNPVSHVGGLLTGGVASTAIPVVGQLGRTAEGASLGTKMYQGAKAGSLLGALSGFGFSEGGVENRGAGAVMGTLGGAALGGTLPAVVQHGGAVVSAAGNRIQAAQNPKGRAESLVGQALLDDIAPNTTGDAAIARVNRKLAQGQGALDTRRATPDVPVAGDSTLRLMDVGGENTRNLVRSAANQKSPAAATLNRHLDTRQANQWRRLERGILEMVKEGDEWFNTGTLRNMEPEQAIDMLTETARQSAKPFFDKARNAKLPVTNKLVEVLNRPGIKRLAELAQESAANEGEDLSKVNAVDLLHRIKMQIDRQIRQARRGIQDSKANWDVRTLVKLKKDLVNAIDVPDYKEALKRYRDPVALRSALEDGMEDGLSTTPEAIRQTMKSLPKNEQTAYRIGISRAIIQKVRTGNVNRDRTDNIFGSPDVQKLIDVVAPTRAAKRQMQRMLVREAKMADSRKAVQGNSTTAKQLTQMNEGAEAARSVQAASSALYGRIAPMLDVVTRHMARLGGMTPEVANEVIKAAMATTGNQSQIALQKAIARARASDAGQEELARVLLRMGIAYTNGTTDRRGR